MWRMHRGLIRHLDVEPVYGGWWWPGTGQDRWATRPTCATQLCRALEMQQRVRTGANAEQRIQTGRERYDNGRNRLPMQLTLSRTIKGVNGWGQHVGLELCLLWRVCCRARQHWSPCMCVSLLGPARLGSRGWKLARPFIESRPWCYSRRSRFLKDILPFLRLVARKSVFSRANLFFECVQRG
jgi:hypothetical protein